VFEGLPFDELKIEDKDSVHDRNQQ
jgi:hypothetical protein